MKLRFSLKILIIFWVLLISEGGFTQQVEPVEFTFGKKAKKGIAIRSAESAVSIQHGIEYGLLGDVVVNQKFFSTAESFAFLINVPEGNYKVQVIIGDEKGSSNTTIKAESRRLMIYNHSTTKGQIDTVSFVVNIRSPKINDSLSIHLKKRELNYLNWDKNLMLEFGGNRPCIRSIRINSIETLPTIFLAGNSTVVDQEEEPWASWGQIIPLFFKPEVAVANFAESGESLRSFEAEKRLAKIESLIKPGDYLFVEFAHNDQKSGWIHVEPYTTYQEMLMKYVEVARQKGATPVLVTSTNRRKFDENGNIVNTLEEYPEAMRQLAKKENILLIDLNAMSKVFFEALGDEGSKKAFVHYAAGTFSWQEEGFADNTHFSTYGAWQLAKCVIEGIRKTDSLLNDLIRDEVKDYDPEKPDAYSSWLWPITKNGSMMKPEGN